jgi:hypothetical protein
VRSLTINGCKQWKLPRVELVSLFNACLVLSELELDGVQSCRDDVIAQFHPTILSQLISIIICPVESKSIDYISDISMRHLNSHCNNLQRIKFHFSSQTISPAEMLKLIHGNPQLKDLTLSWKKRLDRPEFQCIVDWAHTNVLQSDSYSYALTLDANTQYFSVVLNSCHVVKKIISISNKGYMDLSRVNNILKRFNDLTAINLGDTYISASFQPTVFHTLFERNPSLTSLTANFTDWLSDVRCIFEKCPKLTYLSHAGDDLRPRYTVSPLTDSDGLRLQLSKWTDFNPHHHHLNMLVQLILAIPRLRFAELSNFNNTNVDKTSIESTCDQNGVGRISLD